MGLEGVDFIEHRMESFTQLGPLLGAEKASLSPTCGMQSMSKSKSQSNMAGAAPGNSDSLCEQTTSTDSGQVSLEEQLQIFVQAQELLRKSELYQKIDHLMKQVPHYRPNLNFLPLPGDDEEDRVSRLHRDAASHNLRFLNIFYGYGPSSFSLAINLFDRLLGKVKASAKYLSCIAMSCFHIAIKAMEDRRNIPNVSDLIKISQCGGSSADLQRMERLVLEKLEWMVPGSITPLTFLYYFVELVADRLPCFREPIFITSLVAKLEVLMCQFEFAQQRAEVLALALLSHTLQELHVEDIDLFTTLIEVQYYCQIPDSELLNCREMLVDYLRAYCTQRSRLPRLQLNWSVSRRTLNKMRPSQKCLLDLEPIFEDEADEFGEIESDDAGPFDSDNDMSPVMSAPGPNLINCLDNGLNNGELCLKTSRMSISKTPLLAIRGIEEVDGKQSAPICHDIDNNLYGSDTDANNNDSENEDTDCEKESAIAEVGTEVGLPSNDVGQEKPDMMQDSE